MPDYNLAGLSPTSFEQLIQAIAAKVIGPGAVAFGAGPDGAREATFEGKMAYPTAVDPWTGYLVVQAKFLQRPLGTAKDGPWALKQLDAELKKFTLAKRKIRRPDYYIFCTNAVLSPGHLTGARDRATDIFLKYSQHLQLKGWDIWDYDKLRTYIDGMEDIRRAYLAWITPGDVLRKVMEWFDGVEPGFDDVVGGFLQYDLLDDRYARLDQAGHTAKELAPMGSLFIDLPYSHVPDPDPEEEGQDRDFPHGFLQQLLKAGAQKLDPSSLSLIRGGVDSERAYGRYVLIGGPGQGKTTIGQFACQIYRTALLDERANLTPEVRDAVNAVKDQCVALKIDPPHGRRFPIRVVLNDFARQLADRSVRSLLEYLVYLIKERTSHTVSVLTFQKWLGLYPWFLILDGLDEVPPSSNRDEVVQAVTKFLVMANDAGADILVLSTTRPQGYNSDFSSKYYRHRYLTPLSNRRALYYGERLADVTHGHGTSMARDVVRSLSVALDSPTTARLMRSPLQVTIMATLVARGGPAPQERWVLFRRYYNVIYDRETAKRLGEVTELLRSYRTHVDVIHYRVGLTLQIESERSGQTDARLSTEELLRIVSDRLTSEGLTGAAALGVQKKIIDAASDRLVFLVGVREGEIGFEIRSLQEFMAAEALMDGADEDAVERLNRIAPIAHWNNVFLFAAGKCFADRQHLRGTVVDICTTLNESVPGDEIRHRVLIGSQLALLLLQDGLARQQWAHEQALARHACRLRGLREFNAQLAFAYHEGLKEVFEEEILLAPHGATSISLLVALADRGVNWAILLAEGKLRDSVEGYFRTGNLGFSFRLGAWQSKTIQRLLPSLGPKVIDGHYPLQDTPPWLMEINAKFLSVRLTRDGIPTSVVFGLAFLAVPLHMPPPEIMSAPLWQPIVTALRFRNEPSCETLALAIKAFSIYVTQEDRSNFIYRYAPWPLASVLCNQAPGSDWDNLAGRAAKGEFGNPSTWKRAEARWSLSGVEQKDLELFDANALDPGDYLAESGFPFTAAHPESSSSEGMTSGIFDVWSSRSLSKKGSSLVARWICQDANLLLRAEGLAPSDLPDLLSECAASGGYIDLAILRRLGAEHLKEKACTDTIDELGRAGRHFTRHWGESDFQGDLFNIWLGDRSRVGIVSLCSAVECLYGDSRLPTAAFRWRDLGGAPHESAMTFLKICNGELSENDVSSVASRLGSLLLAAGSDHSLKGRLFVSIRQSKGDRMILEKLATELYHRVAPTSPSLAAWIVSPIMDDLIRRRRSGLEDAELRARLRLPLPE